jgi:hypothetical protein
MRMETHAPMIQKLIAVFFSLSFFLPGLVFVLLGKESAIFATAGLAYLLISQCIFWSALLVFKRRNLPRSGLLTVGLGVVLLVAAVPLHQAVEKYDVWRDQQIIAAQRNTIVVDLGDEPFYSTRGNLLGVRLHFAVKFPNEGLFSPWPRLFPAEQALSAFRGLTVIDTVVEPKPSVSGGTRLPLARYDAGITYHFQVDMVPFYLIPTNDGSGYCISLVSEDEKLAAESESETRFRISVGGTSADMYLTGSAPLTGRPYKLRSFYDGALAEGAGRPCDFLRKDK